MRPTNGILLRFNEDTGYAYVRVYRGGVLRWEAAVVEVVPEQWAGYIGQRQLTQPGSREAALGETMAYASRASARLRLLPVRARHDPLADQEAYGDQ